LAETCVERSSGKRVLSLVKDGVLYEAYRSDTGVLELVPSSPDHLPVVSETRKGVRVARVDCGENCYVFDRKILRATLRKVLEFAREGEGSFVLDISRITLVAQSHLQALEHVHTYLEGRQRRLVVVTQSAVVVRQIQLAVPTLQGRIFSREKDAVAAAL